MKFANGSAQSLPENVGLLIYRYQIHHTNIQLAYLHGVYFKILQNKASFSKGGLEDSLAAFSNYQQANLIVKGGLWPFIYP